MKHLNEYILEQSYNIDELILEGKFWTAVGKMLGYNTVKLGQTMKKWGDDLKTGFTTGQYIAAKSKDKEIKKSAEEQAQAAEKGPKELLKQVKLDVQKIMKRMDDIGTSDINYIMQQWDNLKTLSEQENDEEGNQLAEKFKNIIDKKFPDGGKEYENIKNKVKKSPASEGPQGEESNSEDKGNDDIKKEIKQETTETITDNKDLLTPLAKEADVDGKTLRNFVGTQLRKTLGEDQEKIKKKGTREAVQKALGEEVILGTCVMVLGALITKDDTKIQEICKQLQTTSEELKNKLQNYK